VVAELVLFGRFFFGVDVVSATSDDDGWVSLDTRTSILLADWRTYLDEVGVNGVQRGRPDLDNRVEIGAHAGSRVCSSLPARCHTDGDSRRFVDTSAAPSNSYFDPLDLDPGDIGEPGGDRAGQELHLGRPGGFVGFDGEDTVVETNRTNVRSDGVADGVVPSTEDATDLDAIGAAQRLHDPVE